MEATTTAKGAILKKLRVASINRYFQDIEVNVAKGLYFPSVRGTWLPSWDVQVGGGIAINWLRRRVRFGAERRKTPLTPSPSVGATETIMKKKLKSDHPLDAATCSLSDQVAAAVAKIPEDKLQGAAEWTAEYMRQLKARMPDKHLCAFSMAMDGTCFICGAERRGEARADNANTN